MKYVDDMDDAESLVVLIANAADVELFGLGSNRRPNLKFSHFGPPAELRSFKVRATMHSNVEVLNGAERLSEIVKLLNNRLGKGSVMLTTQNGDSKFNNHDQNFIIFMRPDRVAAATAILRSETPLRSLDSRAAPTEGLDH